MEGKMTRKNEATHIPLVAASEGRQETFSIYILALFPKNSKKKVISGEKWIFLSLQKGDG